MVRVDTITFARRLRDSGVPPEQAEATALAVHDYVQDFATKEDLTAIKNELKTALETLRRDLEGVIERTALKTTLGLGSLIVVGIGALAALMKLP